MGDTDWVNGNETAAKREIFLVDERVLESEGKSRDVDMRSALFDSFLRSGNKRVGIAEKSA